MKMTEKHTRRGFLWTGGSIGIGVCTGMSQVLARENIEKLQTGLVQDDRYLGHTLGSTHPESPARLKAIHERLEKSGILKKLLSISPEVDPLPYIKMIHSDEHIQRAGKQAHDETICRLAVSGALSGVDAVCQKKVKNVFCAIRPPGHHAANNGEFGFCFYNNVAVAARYAQKKYGLKKILIVDWDYHHGDGTEWAFYDDPSVLVFSTHALYAFPRSGDEAKTGAGKGVGFNINVPLPRGATDEQVIQAFEEKLTPAAEKFKPDLVLISAGFDAREDDLLGDFKFSDAGFAKLTEIVMAIADKHSESRVVSLLEGGYNIEGLAKAVEAHVKVLSNEQ